MANNFGGRKIKVGIVELRFVANFHIEGYRNNPNIEFCAVNAALASGMFENNFCVPYFRRR